MNKQKPNKIVKTLFDIKENQADDLFEVPPRLTNLEKHGLTGDWNVKMQASGEHVLSYMQEGRASIIVGGKKYKGEKGDIFLYRPHEKHGGKAVNNHEYKTVMFRIDFADEKLHHEMLKKKLEGVNKFPAAENWKLRNILDALIDESEKKQKNTLLIKSYLLETYAVISEYIKNKYLKKKIRKSSRNFKAEICIRAKEYINNNYTKNIMLKEIAGYLALSESRFSHIFKEHAKISPVQYIIKSRIDKAKELLKGTDKKITEIAFETGFSDLTYFNRTFKKLEKQTPSAFRNK